MSDLDDIDDVIDPDPNQDKDMTEYRDQPGKGAG